MFRNFKLIIFVVAICKLSLVSAMVSREIEEQEFNQISQKYKEQIKGSGILIDCLLPIIYEYADLDNMAKQTYKLAQAIKNEDLKELKEAIENGAYVNFEYPGKDTVLTRLLKSRMNKPKLFNFIKYLIENGADVNAKDLYGDTPLILAIKIGLDSIADLLIQNKAIDLNSKNFSEGETALIIAAKVGNYELVKELIEFRADPNIPDEKGQTAYEYAERIYLSGLTRGSVIEGGSSNLENYRKIRDLLSHEIKAAREEDKELQEALKIIQQQEIQGSVRKFNAKKEQLAQEERQRQEEERLRYQRAHEAMAAAAVVQTQEEDWAQEGPEPGEEVEGWGNIDQED